MIGPFVLVAAFVTWGAFSAGWGGAIGAGIAGVAMVGAIAAGAAFWSQAIGQHIDPEMAWEQAPRPPGFAKLCDAVYRRRLPARDGEPS